jgi:hypothetical protein
VRVRGAGAEADAVAWGDDECANGCAARVSAGAIQMNFTNLATAIFGAIGAVFNYIAVRLGLRNAPDMRQRAKDQAEVDAQNAADQAIKSRDEEKTRDVLAE